MEINIENKTSGSDVGKWLTGFSDWKNVLVFIYDLPRRF